MMNYYWVKEELFFNDEKIGEKCGYTMKDREPGSREKIYCGADLLQNIAAIGYLPNELQNVASWDKKIFHRGCVVLCGWGMNFSGTRRDLREEDRIVYKIKYEERTPSIKEVLEYPDGEKAIQWLKDRGITTCSMINPQ